MSQKEITSINDTHYKGLPLMIKHGPYYVSYLETIYRVMHQAMEAHPRTAAFRFDLHLPSDDGDPKKKLWIDGLIDRLINRFIDSLKSQIKYARAKAQRANPYAHTTDIRYIWAREYSKVGKMHFHFVLFLNRDAYHKFGCFGSDRENTYNRVLQAWSSALGFDCTGLVPVPQNAVYELNRNNQQQINEFFHRASYLAKVATKSQGSLHDFGGSRL